MAYPDATNIEAGAHSVWPVTGPAPAAGDQEIVILEADLSLEEDGSDDLGLSALLVLG